MDVNEPIPNTSGRVPIKRQQKLADYRAEIAASTKMMEDDYHENWRRFITMYSDNLNFSSDPAVDSIDVPIGFANVNILRSALTVKHPKFTASASEPVDRSLAATLCRRGRINHGTGITTTSRMRSVRSTDDLLITGNGWIKVGYQLDDCRPEAFGCEPACFVRPLWVARRRMICVWCCLVLTPKSLMKR